MQLAYSDNNEWTQVGDYAGALDASALTHLDYLGCYGNSGLTSLSVPESITYLDCESTGITKLDVSNCPNLQILYCSNTGITALDVSGNPNLRYLNCSETGIDDLDISSNPNLEELITGESISQINNGKFTFDIKQSANGIIKSAFNIDPDTGDIVVSLSATPDFGYKLSKWIGLPEAAVTKNNSASFTLSSDVTVSAEFVLDSSTMLAELNVEGATILPKFQSDIFNYNATVGNAVDKINITAKANDRGATITGIGEKTLKVGKNTFKITVTTPGQVEGEEISREYVITITREAKGVDPNTGDGMNIFYPAVLLRIVFSKSLQAILKLY